MCQIWSVKHNHWWYFNTILTFIWIVMYLPLAFEFGVEWIWSQLYGVCWNRGRKCAPWRPLVLTPERFTGLEVHGCRNGGTSSYFLCFSDFFRDTYYNFTFSNIKKRPKSKDKLLCGLIKLRYFVRGEDSTSPQRFQDVLWGIAEQKKT